MSCQCFECLIDREDIGDYWLTDEQLRFDCLRALGFHPDYVFISIWGE